MPGFGAGGSKFQLSTGWRFARADTDYFGSRINRTFTDNWRPFERISILDVTGRYNFNRRYSLTAYMPIVFNEWSNLFPPQGFGRGKRFELPARGVGDLSLFGQGWLLDSKKHPFHNLALGVGLKFPTGNWRSHANYPALSGQGPIVNKSVFPAAIMPGDGGLGIALGFDSYKIFRRPTFYRGITMFCSGVYLLNPRNVNGTPSAVQLAGIPLTSNFGNVLYNSVTDSWGLRVGLSLPLPGARDNEWLKGARVLAIGQGEGVPAKDLFGRSDGFRQPGYSMAVGPGLSYTKGKDNWTVECPIVFARYINPGKTLLPSGSNRINFRSQIGLVPPMVLQLRWTHSF